MREISTIRLYTIQCLDGIEGRDEWLAKDPDLMAALDKAGAVRTTCWCCGKRIVVKQGQGDWLTDADKAYLEGAQ